MLMERSGGGFDGSRFYFLRQLDRSLQQRIKLFWRFFLRESSRMVEDKLNVAGSTPARNWHSPNLGRAFRLRDRRHVIIINFLLFGVVGAYFQYDLIWRFYVANVSGFMTMPIRLATARIFFCCSVRLQLKQKMMRWKKTKQAQIFSFFGSVTPWDSVKRF